VIEKESVWKRKREIDSAVCPANVITRWHDRRKRRIHFFSLRFLLLSSSSVYTEHTYIRARAAKTHSGRATRIGRKVVHPRRRLQLFSSSFISELKKNKIIIIINVGNRFGTNVYIIKNRVFSFPVTRSKPF